MKIEKESPVVVITIPRITVPKQFAQEFISLAIKFFNDVQISQVENELANIKYDSRYCDGDFIPTVQCGNSYTGALNQIIDVQQIDKYVLLEDDKYVHCSEIQMLWKSQLEEQIIKQGVDYKVKGYTNEWSLIDTYKNYGLLENTTYGDETCYLLVNLDAGVEDNTILEVIAETYDGIKIALRDEGLLQEGD